MADPFAAQYVRGIEGLRLHFDGLAEVADEMRRRRDLLAGALDKEDPATAFSRSHQVTSAALKDNVVSMRLASKQKPQKGI